ncbi:MAG: peptide-methionine (R)-S-oxide reductase [Bacteroidota bacterium]
MLSRRSIDFSGQTRSSGVYECTSCGENLFRDSERFDSGTGFPSFWGAIEEQVSHRHLATYGRERTQLVCGHCTTHLGHLFEDRRTPSGVRYCIRRDAITLRTNKNPEAWRS